MNQSIVIRPEMPIDIEALTLSLLAELDGRVVGHIAFSPLTMPGGTSGWYGLGPVSVLPEFQRQGIGGMNDEC